MSVAAAHTPVSTPDYTNRARRWGGACSTFSAVLTHNSQTRPLAHTTALLSLNPFAMAYTFFRGYVHLSCTAGPFNAEHHPANIICLLTDVWYPTLYDIVHIL